VWECREKLLALLKAMRLMEVCVTDNEENNFAALLLFQSIFHRMRKIFKKLASKGPSKKAPSTLTPNTRNPVHSTLNTKH